MTVKNARTRPRRELILLAALLVVGLGVRLHGLDRQPLQFHPTRQYRSALIARAVYLDRTRPRTDSYRILADGAAKAEGTLEPPIIEHLVATSYQLTGAERLWLARLMSSLFWLFGGLAVWLLLRRMTGLAGSAVGLAAYVLLRLGVEGGRSFQPDSLMVATMLFAILSLVRLDERPTLGRLLEAAGLSALSMFVKPMSAPMILAAFAALHVHRNGWRVGLLNRRSGIYLVVTLLPLALFYVDGLYVAGFLRGQADSSFIPKLLLRGSFYADWIRIVSQTLSLPLVGLSAAAILLVRGRWRWLLGSLWVGYLVFGLAFDYRTATHTYYHLQLVPVVALGLGVLADRVAAGLRDDRLSGITRWAAALSAVVLLASAVKGAIDVSPPANGQDRIAIATARLIGERVGHSRGVLFMTDAYGKDLEFYGHVVGAVYPSRADVALLQLQGSRTHSVKTLLETPIDGKRPEWFAVTSWNEWQVQPELRAYLASHYRLAAGGHHWRVYDLRHARSITR